MNFSKLIETIRDRNMSVRQVAIKADITPQGLYAALNGKSEFWPAWRKRVAEALDVPEEELFPKDE